MSKRGPMASACFTYERIMLNQNDIIPKLVDFILPFGYNVFVILCVEVSHYG